MSIQNAMPIVYNRTIENPLNRYDKNLARKIDLLENPKNKKNVEFDLQKKIVDLNKKKDWRTKNITKIENDLTIINPQILPEKHLTTFEKCIEAISQFFYSLFLGPKPDPNASLLSQKATLLSRKNESVEDLVKINRDLSATRRLIHGIPQNIDEEIENAKKQITNDLNGNFKIQINGKKFSDPSKALEALEEISPIYKPGTFTLLQLSTPTLSILLKNATIDLLNESFKYTSDNAQFTVKENQNKTLISIEVTEEGKFTISTHAVHEVSGPRGEFFTLNSKIDVHLDENGLVQDASISNDVSDYPAPQGTFFSPRVTDRHYQMPPIDKAQFVDVALNDSEEPVWVSKNFKGDCDRQINHLHIKGIGTLTHRHTKLIEAKDRLNNLREELEQEIQKPQNADQPDYIMQLNETFEEILDKNNQIKEQLRTDIFNDFLKILLEKLGPKRAHLLPQVTYLFDPASGAILEKLIDSKYNTLTSREMRKLDEGGYKFTLDIPEDENQPISITCEAHGTAISDKRGKIETFDITAKGFYTIHPLDGHIEFEGSVSEPLSPDVIGFV